VGEEKKNLLEEWRNSQLLSKFCHYACLCIGYDDNSLH